MKFQGRDIPLYHDDIILNDKECAKIIRDNQSGYREKGKVKGELTEVRDATIYPLDWISNFELYKKVEDWVWDNNEKYFGYNLSLTASPVFQLIRYDVDGFYDWHMDLGLGENNSRKLSVVIQLSNPTSYAGGELLFNNGEIHEAPKVQGNIAMFPSYLLHMVTPVTKGTRWSLVGWYEGGSFV